MDNDYCFYGDKCAEYWNFLEGKNTEGVISGMNDAQCSDCVDYTGEIESGVGASDQHFVDWEGEVDCPDLEDSENGGGNADDKNHLNVLVNEIYSLLERTKENIP